MRLDGFGLFVNDMGKMIRFYRDVLGFEIKEGGRYIKCVSCEGQHSVSSLWKK